MKKIGLLLFSVILFSTLSAQTELTCKFQERDFFPQQDEGGKVLYRDHSPGEILKIVYESKYQDTVYVYFLGNWELKVTDTEVYFDCKFTNFVLKYKKKKGQIKKYYDRGDKKGLELYVGTYTNSHNETLLIRQVSDSYNGDFSGSLRDLVVKKGNNIYVFVF